MAAYLAELVESEIASFRIAKLSASQDSPPLQSHSLADDARRGLPPEVVRKVENLRHLLSTRSIAERLGISRSTVLRIIRAAKRREAHNYEPHFPQMRGLL